MIASPMGRCDMEISILEGISMSVTRRRIAHAALLASASFLSLTLASPAQAQCTASPGSPPLNNLPTDVVVTCTGTTSGQTIILNGVSVDVNVNAGSTLNNSTVTINGPDGRVNFGSTAGPVTTLLNVTTTSPGNPAATNVRFTNVSGTNIVAQVGGQASNLRFLSASAITAVPGNITLTGATNNPGPGGNGTLTIEGGSSVFALGPANSSYLLATGAGNETVLVSDSTVLAASDGLLISTGAGSDLINIWGDSQLVSVGGAASSIDGGADFDRIRWRGGTGAVVHNVNVTNIEEAVFETLSANAPLVMRGSADYSTVFVGGVGTTRFDDVAALGSNTAAVQVISGATLQLNANAIATYNQVFSGGGTIRQTEGVNIYNGNSANFSGTFILDFNRAILGNANAFGTADIVNNSLLFFADFDLANDISGTGQIIVTGNGTARLSGTNTFSGGIDIRAGLLEVSRVTSLGTGNIISSTGGGALVVRNNADEVLANNILGNLGFVKGGTGTLDLTGNNTYAFGTLIQEGAIRVDSFGRLGTGIVVANQGASLILDYNGAGQLLQTTTFLNGDGAFIKEGTGDVVLDVASGYTGGTIIREGRLGLNNGSALGTGGVQIDAGAELGIGGVILSNDLTGSGLVRKTASNVAEIYGDNSGFTGTIRVEDGIVFAVSGDALGAGTLEIGSGTSVQLGAAADSTVAAVLAGAGNFEKLGGGTVTLTGTGSQFSGGIGVTDGTLRIAGSQNIGTAGVFLGSNATLLLDTAGSTSLGNVVFGSGRVVKTGAGTVFMTGANTYSGGTDIQQGAIRVTDVSVLGTGPITVQQGAALDLSIAGAQTLSQNVTGAGILRKSDTGDLTLLANGLTGGVDITNGRVIVTNASALGGGPVTTAIGTRLVFDNAATEALGTTISGAGGLTKSGTGLLAINTANSYTGGTTISAGRIALNDGMGLGTGTITIQQGAILGIGGVNVANAITGAGRVIKTANNTATLTGNNAYSGGTDIQQGDLRVTSPASLGTGGVQMASGTQLIVDYSGANNVALNNVLSGAGALVKKGSGTVVMNAQGNTYSGGTTINAGRLGLNFGDALGTGGVTIASGAELAIGDIQLANNVSGAGRIIKTSAGTSSLTGTNTHGGGIAIQAGALAVSGNGALGTGAIAIGSGASLDYTNAGNATFSNGLSGAGTFTKLGAGQLTFANNFTLGALNAAAGRTRINVVATTNATVASGASLDGTGRIVGNGCAGQQHRHADGAGQLHPQCRIGAGDRVRRQRQYRPARCDGQCDAERRHDPLCRGGRGRGAGGHLPAHRRHADGHLLDHRDSRRAASAFGVLPSQCCADGAFGADCEALDLQRAEPCRGRYGAGLYRIARAGRCAPWPGQPPVDVGLWRLGQPQRIGHHASL